MADNIKISYNYLNPHEEYYTKFKTRSTYNKYTDNMFQQAARRGELEIMEYTLDALQDKADAGELDLDKLSKEFRFDLLTDDTFESIIYNELYGDRDKIVEYEEQVWNADKARYETMSYSISEYELNRKLFQDRVKYEVEQDAIRLAEETKKNRNGFVKAVSAVGDFLLDIPLDMFYGVVDFTADTLAFVEGIGRWVGGGFNAEDFEKAYIKDKAVLSAWRDTGWMQEMQKWQGKWGYIRDTQGNYTSYGKFVGGVSYSIGEMLPSLAISLATGGAGGAITTAAKGASGAAKVALKVAAYAVSHLSEAVYYTGLTSGTFREMVNDPKMANVSASKKMLSAAAKGAAEWAVQAGLNQCFGASMMDKAVFGYKGSSKAIGKIGKLSTLKTIGIDAFHEGLEEMFQQYSNYIVDSFFAVTDSNYNVEDWNFKTMVTAFFMGAISSVATGTFGVLTKGAKNRIQINKETARVKNALQAGVYSTIADIDTQINTLNSEKLKLQENVSQVLNFVGTDKNVSVDRITKIDEEIKSLEKQKSELETEYKLNKNQWVFFKNGKIINTRPKMDILTSYSFDDTLQDLYQQYKDLIEDSSLTDFERNQAVGQMLVTMSTLAAMFTEIGPDNVAKAQKMLDTMKKNRLELLGITETKDGLVVKRQGVFSKALGDEVLTGVQAEARSELLGKETYDFMAYQLMQTLDNIKSDYIQRVINGLPIDTQRVVANQSEKLTKKKRSRKGEPKTNQEVTEDAVEMTKKVVDELGVSNIEITDGGPETVNVQATVATRVDREVKHLPEGADVEAMKRIATLCTEFNITLDDFNSLPTDVQQLVIKKNLVTGRKALKDFYAKDYSSRIEKPAKASKPVEIHKATSTDAQAVIDEVRNTVISEPVQALTEANELMTVAKAIADLALPTALATNPKYRILFKELYFVAKQIDSTINTVDDAMTKLLMDDEFAHNMVWSASEQMYEFYGNLEQIVKTAIRKNAIDIAIKNRIQLALDTIKHELIEYSIAVKDSKPELLSVFTTEEAREIRNKRFGRDFISKLTMVNSPIDIRYTMNGDNIDITITGDTQYTHLGSVLSKAINSLGMYGKQDIIKALHEYVNDKSILNKSNLASSLIKYIGQFANPYYNSDYFNIDTPEGVIANTFFEKYGITRNTFTNFTELKRLASTKLVQSMLKTVFGNNAEFDITNKDKLGTQMFALFSTLFAKQNKYKYKLTLNGTDYNFQQDNYSEVKERIKGIGVIKSSLSDAQVFEKMFSADFSLRSLGVQTETGLFDIVSNRILINGIEKNIFQAYDTLETTLLKDSISDEVVAGLTINDLITQVSVKDGEYSSLLLSHTVQDQIKKRYGNVTPEAIFAYLRSYFIIRSDGNIGIVMDTKGKINMVSVKSMQESFVSDIDKILYNGDVSSLTGKKFSLTELIGSTYAYGYLKDTYVSFETRRDGDGYGMSYDGGIKIYLSPTDTLAEIKYTLLHEIKHQIQDTYGLTPGFSQSYIVSGSGIRDGINTVSLKTFAMDIKNYTSGNRYIDSEDYYTKMLGNKTVEKIKKKHGFNTEILDAWLVARFVYLTSGETEAYGTSLSSVDGEYIANFTPTIVDPTSDKFTVIAPWGLEYNLYYDNKNKNKRIADSIIQMTDIDETSDSLLSYDFMILTDNGEIKVDHKYNNVLELEQDVGRSFTDSTVYIENVSGNGSTKFNINIGNLEFTQGKYDGIVRAINLLVQGGADVHITVPFTGLDIDVTSESEFSAQDALLAVGIGSPDPDKQTFRRMSESVDIDNPTTKKNEKILKNNRKNAKEDKRHKNKGVKTDTPRTTRTNDVFVSKKWLIDNDLQDSGAQFFVGKQRNLSIIRLASEVDFTKVDPILSEAIQDGSLTLQSLYKLIRQGDILDPKKSTSQYTLEILNDTIFHNPYIDTPEMLENISQVSLADYYALRRIIMLDNGEYLLDSVLPSTQFEFFVEKYKNDPKFKEKYNEYIEQFHKEYSNVNGGNYRIDYGTLRVKVLQRFDGTIQSGYDIAKSEIFAARAGFARNDIQNQMSIDKNVGFLKGGTEGGDMELQDVIDKRNALWDVFDSFDLDNVLDRLSFVSDAEQALIDYYIETIFNPKADKIQWRSTDARARALDTFIYGSDKKEGVEQKLRKKESSMSSEQYVNWLIDQVAQYAYQFMPEELVSTDVSKRGGEYVSRKPKNVKAYIAKVAKRINEWMSVKSEASKRAFLKYYGEYFNDDLTLKGNYYMGKNVPANMERYIETRNILSKISKEVNAGRFDHGEKSVREYDRKQREDNQRKESKKQLMVSQEKYRRVRTKLDEERKKHVSEFSVGKNTVSVVGNVDIPETFRNIMNATYTRFADTNVKYLTGEGEVHAVQSVKEFTNANAETFANMSSEDIQELAKFLIENQVFSDDDESTARAQFYRVLTLVQLEAMNNEFGGTILDKDTILKMDQVIKFWEQRAGRDLTATRDIAKTLKPFKQILIDITHRAGYEFTESEQQEVDKKLDEVYNAIRDDALNSTKETLAMLQSKAKEYYDLLLKIDSKHGRKGLDNFVDKLWKFQRMAMLSSPGTWGRNYVSNAVVAVTNKAADGLGHLIFDKIGKAKQIEGQYRMDAKPTQQVKEYIQREFFTIIKVDKNGNPVEVDASGKPIDPTIKTKNVTLYDLLSDGLNKWSPTMDSKFDIDEALASVPNYMEVTSQGYPTGRKDSERITKERAKVAQKAYSKVLTQMVAHAVQSKLFMEHQFGQTKAGEVMNKISKVLFTVLSDDPFIKRTTNNYFAKILQESIVDGKIDVKGLTQGTNTELEHKTRLQVLKLFSEAYGLAAFDYMHRQNFINKIETQLSGHNKYLMALYKQVLPFASAGWNWFLEGTKYTPVGLVSGIVKYSRLEKRIAKAQADYKLGKYQGPDIKFIQFLAKRDVGKGIIGTLGFAFGMFLAGMGWMAIDEEDDKMKLTLGDVKVDITDIFGTSGLLVGAAIMSGAKDKIGIWKTLIRATDIFLEDSLFNDMFTTFTRGDTIGETLLNMPFDKLSAFVPNIVKSITKLTYTYKPQYSTGFMGKLERWGVQNIPGIVHTLPKRYDPYTGEYQMAYAGGPVLAWLQKFSSIVGVKIYKYDITDTELQARSLGVTKGELSCNYKDIAPFDSKHKAMANQLYGEWNKRDLDKFYSNKTKYRVQMSDGTYKELRYREMSDKQRKTVTERIMSDNSSLAKIYVYTQVIGGKYYASESEYEELRKAGIKTNVYRENKKKELTGFM